MLSEHSNLCYVLKPLDFEVLKLHYKLLLREERNDLIYGENKSGVTVNQLLGSLGELRMDTMLLQRKHFLLRASRDLQSLRALLFVSQSSIPAGCWKAAFSTAHKHTLHFRLLLSHVKSLVFLRS